MDAAQAEANHSRIQAWFLRRGDWARRGIALLAGGLATLGHAPFQIVPAYALALVLVVWLIDAAVARGKRFWACFGVGWWFALGHFSTGLYWISSAFTVDPTFGLPLGIVSTLALAAGLALFWAFGCALASLMWTQDMRRLPAFAIAVFASEWLRGHLFGGFPWLLPGYVWTPGEPVSQLASLFGIYGLSLVSLLLLATPAAVADGQQSVGRRVAPMIAGALVLGLVLGWGTKRLQDAPIELPGALPIVRVADPGLGQAEKWAARADQEDRVLQAYLQASGLPDQSDARVVVWPEGAIPTINFFLLDNPAFLDKISRAFGDRALITGLTRCEPTQQCDAYMLGIGNADRLKLYNSAAVIYGSGAVRLTQTYDKHRLVPFGEFIPLWSLVSKVNFAPLQRIGAGFTPGPAPTRLVVPEAPPAAILICYEAIFPGLVPRGDERPGWIVNVTNDAWFGKGTGPWQHFVAARYRSIEEGLPMARSASGGISAIIDSFGRIVRSTASGADHAEAQLPPALPQPPPASHVGILLQLLVLALFGGLRFATSAALTRGIKS